MTRYVCVHGHFYQPPRENPWSGEIEPQPSAAPHRDWNVRISEECYAPNAAARILDDDGRPLKTVNNYARISFNFGPTLLSWLERHAGDVYRAILEADRAHGSAMAQAHGHMILPLANARDRACQVAWGVRDFEWRFGRRPRGMWLPETAVDLATLETLAAADIRFTILAPHQARRVRDPCHSEWREVTEDSLDTTLAYRQRLPSGKEIALFFYDGPTSRAIAFEGLLRDGRELADRLVRIVPDGADGPRLAHVATDGESYGHHHKFGEMALAYALENLAARKGIALTHYSAFLETRPPRHEVEIGEPTSWSCPHGVDRWRADCGCGSTTREGWNQGWRGPLRAALDRLRDTVTRPYEQWAGLLLRDPWSAREAYVDVLLDPGVPSRAAFLADHARRDLRDAEREAVWKWLELQRHAMLMYTSCGWFFEDPARIETIQLLRYAGRVVELARDLGLSDPEPHLLEQLDEVRSNDPARGSARDLYLRHVTHREPAI
jgi:alpha-amylase/alpha-mannosidase (GH57 family)